MTLSNSDCFLIAGGCVLLGGGIATAVHYIMERRAQKKARPIIDPHPELKDHLACVCANTERIKHLTPDHVDAADCDMFHGELGVYYYTKAEGFRVCCPGCNSDVNPTPAADNSWTCMFCHKITDAPYLDNSPCAIWDGPGSPRDLTLAGVASRAKSYRMRHDGLPTKVDPSGDSDCANCSVVAGGGDIRDCPMGCPNRHKMVKA
jgi:hypothetical protein